MLKETSRVDSPHKQTENMMILRREIQTSSTTDDAGRDGSARYWKTARKEKTALKKFQDKENIILCLLDCDS